MASHLVYRLSNPGPNHTLKRVAEPKPTIDKHEVLVKIKGISLNYRDIAIAEGTYPFPSKDNLVPFSDAAGEVVGLGSSVEGFDLGDNVIANFDASNLYGQQQDFNHAHGGPIDGVLREYVPFPASVLIKIPKDASLSFTQMASLVCTGTTAWNALYGNVPLKPGQTILFQGASFPLTYTIY